MYPAKMAASVQVLCPNGRRQNVKVNPNTKLLQVLEEVCQRQGFIPPEDYKLVQGRKEFDLSLSVRYASIPNNAKLELVKSALSRTEQEITIALQLASGQRYQQSFQPSANLWDILLSYESKNSEVKGILTRVDTSLTPALHPVCIYMREEVVGEQALKATTLRKLGLTSGKAIIRHLHRPVEEGTLGKIVDNVEREKEKQARLEEIALRKNELREMDELMERDRESHRAAALYSVPESQGETQVMKMDAETEPSLMDQGADEPMVQDQSNESVTSTTPTGLYSQGPEEHSSPIQHLRNLNIPGVEIFTPDDFSDLSPQEQAIAQRLAARFLPQLQAAGVAPPSIGHAQATVLGQPASSGRPEHSQGQERVYQSFENFKFPEATKGKDLSDNQKTRSLLETSCDREPILYDGNEPLAQETKAQDSDLPDDFFEVTKNDVKLMYRDLQNAVKRLEDQPLLTTTLRNERLESMFDAYDRIVIRVQFPDRFVLQGLFRPREPVSALRSFVKENVEHKNDRFYLYTTPPREVLKVKEDKASLAASKLAPAAVVFYGSETPRDTYVSQEFMENIRPRIEAEKIVSQILHPDVSSDPGPSGCGTRFPPEEARFDSHRMAGGSSSSSSRSTLPSGTPVPKWLKLGKK